jgi:hypothetical protein
MSCIGHLFAGVPQREARRRRLLRRRRTRFGGLALLLRRLATRWTVAEKAVRWSARYESRLLGEQCELEATASTQVRLQLGDHPPDGPYRYAHLAGYPVVGVSLREQV